MRQQGAEKHAFSNTLLANGDVVHIVFLCHMENGTKNIQGVDMRSIPCFVKWLLGVVALVGWANTAMPEVIPDYYADRELSGMQASDSRLTEEVDTFGGSLNIEFQSIRIPGTGGLDIVVRHFYSNHQNGNGEQPVMSVGGVGWNFHFGRVLSNREDMCISIPNDPTKYPVLETPDGKRQILFPATEHSFDFITVNRWRVECIPSSGGFLVYAPDGMKYIMDEKNTNGVHGWYTTSITDLNGNRITVQYAGSADQFRITRVNGTDGRVVNFSYLGENGGILRLSAVSASSRIWRFIYGEFNNARGKYYLKTIDPPSGNNWSFAYIDSANAQTKGNFSLYKITNPDGGTISYAYDWVQFDPAYSLYTTVVKTKTTDDLKGNVGTWRYSYNPAGSAYSNPSCSSTLYDKTTVVTPKGTEYYYHYGASMATDGCIWRIGMIRSKEIGPYKEIYSWSSQKISDMVNGRPQRPDKQDAKVYSPILTGRTVVLDGSEYVTIFSNYDGYGNPGKVVETGTSSRTKYMTYNIDAQKWIINRLSGETLSGIGSIVRSYYPSGNLKSITRYGVKTSYTYYTNGNVRSMTNGRGKTTEYSNYYHGIPREEKRPEGVVIKRVVDYFGNVLSETDGNGFTTNYSYDGIDRLTGVDFPQYADKMIAWSTRKKVESSGGYSKTTYFDGFGRPVYVMESGDDPAVGVSFKYDALGNMVFKSYVGSSNGDIFMYDQIGRITKITHSDNTYRTFSYLAGGNVKVVNERGKATTKAYRAYGDPLNEKYLRYVSDPENMDTEIGRNALGQITFVKQNGRIRDYGYYANRTLKSIKDPETGLTVFGRDNNGNMTSIKVGGSPITYFTYDDLDRLTYIDYPGSDPDVAFGYDKNGNVVVVDNGVARWIYGYDKRNNLKSETLYIDGKRYGITYGYTSLGHLNSIAYPASSGRVVNYDADSLGRSTKALPYASAATHWASGPRRHYRYSNGRYLDTLLNSRRWLSSLKISGAGSGSPPWFEYSYDGTGNIDIVDRSMPSNSINNTYDGVDRLVTTNSSGNWGVGSISYSGDGDILSYRLGDDRLTYSYSSSNNRLASVDKNNSSYLSFVYDVYGNVVSDGIHSYGFNHAGDLVSMDSDIVNEYDGNRNRVTRIKEGVLGYFVYSRDGNLLGEYSETGKWVKEYVYLDGELIAEVENVPGMVRSLQVPNTSETGGFLVKWSRVYRDAPEFYELYESSQSDYSTQHLVYRGSSLSVSLSGRQDGDYYYRLRACNSLEVCSEYVEADHPLKVRHAPQKPSSITYPSTNQTGNYDISWRVGSGTLTHYELEEATSSSYRDAVQVYSGADIGFSMTSKPSGDYYYRVRACNDFACSDYRKGHVRLRVRMPPGTPADIRYPDTTTTGYFLASWGVAAGTVTHYELEEAENVDFTGRRRVYSGPGLKTYVSLRNLGEYYYRVRACNDFACGAYRTGGKLTFMDDPSLIFKDGFE